MHIVFLTALLLGTALAAAAEPPAGSGTWRGEIALTAAVRVAPGDRLELAPGTRVTVSGEGSLQVDGELAARGTAEAPIALTGPRDGAAPLVTVSAGGRLELGHVRVAGAGTGIAVRGGSVTGRHLEFAGNGTGLVLDVKARGRLEDATFADNDVALAVNNTSDCEARRLSFQKNRVGLAVSNSSRLLLEHGRFTDNGVGYGQHNACDTRLERCTFEGNDTAVGLKQSRRSPTIRHSAFRRNQTAVAANLFSHALVEGSTFADNQRGVAAVNVCGVFLRYNTFAGNDQAILLDHKSNARIEHNRLEGNRVALFADYSSYPRVSANRFADNQWHVRLGIYQSADWERRQGSRGLMMQAARDANSRNPVMLKGGLPEGEHVFSVAGNAWDDATAAELGAGEEANISRFWDGRDQEPVSYPGFGDGAFAVDVIRFTPPLTGAPPAVGPEAWRPLEPGEAGAPDEGAAPGGGPFTGQAPAGGAAPPAKP